jgi:hypothetical protein
MHIAGRRPADARAVAGSPWKQTGSRAGKTLTDLGWHSNADKEAHPS